MDEQRRPLLRLPGGNGAPFLQLGQRFRSGRVSPDPAHQDGGSRRGGQSVAADGHLGKRPGQHGAAGRARQKHRHRQKGENRRQNHAAAGGDAPHRPGRSGGRVRDEQGRRQQAEYGQQDILYSGAEHGASPSFLW